MTTEFRTNPNTEAYGSFTRNGCAICGDQGGQIPVVRYWDADDGWLLGGLCGSCYPHCRAPREDDYAYGIDGDAFFTQDIPDDVR